MKKWSIIGVMARQEPLVHFWQQVSSSWTYQDSLKEKALRLTRSLHSEKWHASFIKEPWKQQSLHGAKDWYLKATRCAMVSQATAYFFTLWQDGITDSQKKLKSSCFKQIMTIRAYLRMLCRSIECERWCLHERCHCRAFSSLQRTIRIDKDLL